MVMQIAQDLGIIVLVVALGCIGGQPAFSKAFRRYGIALIAMGKARKEKWKAFIFSSLGIVLSMGYGESSKLSKVAPQDWQRRVIYGLLLSIPFAVFKLFLPVVVLPVIWLIHLPYSHKIGDFELLWEDVLRYSALGYCITMLHM